MKKTIVIFVTILTFTLFAYSEVKIGIINAQKLVEGTKKGKEIAQRFEKLKKEKEDKFTSMQNEVRKLEKELLSPALNNETREKKSLELQDKKTALKRYAEDSQRELQIKLQQEMNALKEQISPIIQQIGKDRGFTIILEVPAVTYFDPAIDITDDIIKIMDSK